MSCLVSADRFPYTSEDNAIVIKGVDDAEQFVDTCKALALLGQFLVPSIHSGISLL